MKKEIKERMEKTIGNIIAQVIDIRKDLKDLEYYLKIKDFTGAEGKAINIMSRTKTILQFLERLYTLKDIAEIQNDKIKRLITKYEQYIKADIHLLDKATKFEELIKELKKFQIEYEGRN